MGLVLFPVIASVALALLMRPLWLWYFQIDRAIALLGSIDESLKQLPAVREHDSSGQRMHAIE